MIEKFYSERHAQRVQKMENEDLGNGLLIGALLVLIALVLGVVGHMDIQGITLASETPQTALEQVTGGLVSITEPMDIQPAYGINAFQHASSSWRLQGGTQ